MTPDEYGSTDSGLGPVSRSGGRTTVWKSDVIVDSLKICLLESTEVPSAVLEQHIRVFECVRCFDTLQLEMPCGGLFREPILNRSYRLMLR
jgi:hypothetical protein